MTKQHFPIIFDLDGTLFDCLELTNQTFPHVLDSLEAKYGDRIQIQRFSRYETFLGRVEEDIFAELLPGADKELLEEAQELLIDIEYKLIPEAGKLFDGVEKVLKELAAKGHPLFIASNGSKPYVHKVLESFSLREYFTGVYSAGEHQTESKNDLVGHLLKEHSLSGGGVMVGDRHSDMEAGKVNGLFTVGCLYGFGDEEETAGADVKIDRLEDLVEVADRLGKGTF
jgi:phosphoglycolate phosphatase-like HAD superfamily hydrolase